MAAQLNHEREFLKPREVAAVIGTRVETVHLWIHTGELAAANLARPGAKLPRFVVRREDLDAFVAARSVSAAKPVKAPRRAKRAGRQWV